MKFKVGEVVEVIADNGDNCGRYTINEIADDGDRVWFESNIFGYTRPMDRIRRCRKIIRPGAQLEFDW